MTTFLSGMKSINEFLWSGPLLFLLMGTHLYFTIKLHVPQKKILEAIRLSVTPESQENTGNLSVFATLATTLAATLGTGNIIGVSTAIALGGPGAIFWCWITGILGMATAYSECFLSVLFRKKNADGQNRGGPMYLWENGLRNKSVGKFYALLTVVAAFGVGCTTQSNSITQTTSASFGLSPQIAGFLAAVLREDRTLSGRSVHGRLRSPAFPEPGGPAARPSPDPEKRPLPQSRRRRRSGGLPHAHHPLRHRQGPVYQ